MFNNEPVMFQQDGAPAHRQKTLKSGFVPKFRNWSVRSNGPHPAQTSTQWKTRTKLESLKQSLSHGWYQIPQQLCVPRDGRHPHNSGLLLRKKANILNKINKLAFQV